MTSDEAFAELGLERPVDADVVRRRYLQLLKTRKPETDPVGFQRLREAYDLLRGITALEASFAAQQAPDPPREHTGAVVELVHRRAP